MKQLLILLLAILLIFPLVSAAEYKAVQNQAYNITVPCELNGWFCGSSTVCNASLQYQKTSAYIINNQKVNVSGSYVIIPLNITQTAVAGEYIGDVKCNNPTTGLNASTSFTLLVNQSGEELSISNALLYIGLLAILLLVLVFAVNGFSEANYGWKLARIAAVYFIALAGTFVIWSLVNGFLTTVPFLERMLYIIWYTLMWGIIPFILVLIVMFFNSLLKTTEVNTLIKRGHSQEEANARANKR